MPADIYLGEAAGVATNSKGHLFVYTRTGNPTVGLGNSRLFTHGGSRLFEFDQNGAFVREIGQGIYAFLVAHAVRVDAQDNIWIVDEGSNQVVKFGPDGRVLMILGRKPEAISIRSPADSATGARDADVAVCPAPAAPAISSPVPATSPGTPTATSSSPTATAPTHASRSSIATAASSCRGASRGAEPGQFNTPHSIATDAQGQRLRRRPGQQAHSGLRQQRDVQVADHERRRADGDLHLRAVASVSVQLAHRRSRTGWTTRRSTSWSSTAAIVGKFGQAGKQPKEFGLVNAIDCRADERAVRRRAVELARAEADAPCGRRAPERMNHGRHEPSQVPRYARRRVRVDDRPSTRARRPRLHCTQRHDPAGAGRLRHAGAASGQHRHGRRDRTCSSSPSSIPTRTARTISTGSHFGNRQRIRRFLGDDDWGASDTGIRAGRDVRHGKSWRRTTRSRIVRAPASGPTRTTARCSRRKPTSRASSTSRRITSTRASISRRCKKGKAAIAHKPLASVLYEVRRTLQVAARAPRRHASAGLQQHAGPPPARGDDQRRRHRHGPRSAQLDESSLLAARLAGVLRVRSARAGRLQLGVVAGTRAESSVSPELHVLPSIAAGTPYGVGCLGDMGFYSLWQPYRILNLGVPEFVEARPNNDACRQRASTSATAGIVSLVGLPKASVVRWRHPATADRVRRSTRSGTTAA